jgi:hypothetical protein
MHFRKLPLVAFATLAASPVFACDLCGCYTPRIEVAASAPIGFWAGVAEQFTHFSVDRIDGAEVKNPTGQYLDSSITQLVTGVRFLDHRLGLQLNVPLIYRSYKRPAGFAIDRGHESGIGDVSLLASAVLFRKGERSGEMQCTSSKDGKSSSLASAPEHAFRARVTVLAGIKAPTGDSSRIGEEFQEIEVEGAPESGIHGHDLALGTGSWDGIFAIGGSVGYRAVFFEAEAQFTLRGAGHYSYHFANDLAWSGGPGVYILRDDERTLALQCAVSGESKDTDVFRGRPAADTGVTSLYVGPRVLAKFGRVTAEVGADFPVLMHTTAFQTTAEYRLRAALTIAF